MGFHLLEDMQLSVRWISEKRNLPCYLSMLNMRSREIARAFSITESTCSRSGFPSSLEKRTSSPHPPVAISNLNFNSTQTVRALDLPKFQVQKSITGPIYPLRRQPASLHVQ